MPRSVRNPTDAIRSLSVRAEAVAPGAFEADVRHLFFLARRLEAAVRAGEEGAERDATREFGLQFRATAGAVLRVEEAAAARVVEVVDWKAEMDRAVSGAGG